MKKTLLLLLLAAAFFGGCKDHLAGNGCDSPPYLLFELLSSTGQPAVVAPDTVLTVSFQLAGQPLQHLTLKPQRAAELHDYVYSSYELASYSIGRTQTYYLTQGGRTDTLTLRALDECGYSQQVTFDGRPATHVTTPQNLSNCYLLRRR